MVANDLEKYQMELVNRLDQIKGIVSGLENNTSFKELLKDFERNKVMADSAWHETTDPKLLDQLRVLKFSSVTLLTVLDSYKAEIDSIEKELFKMEHPEEVIQKDYDQ
jgi:hypothetical protein